MTKIARALLALSVLHLTACASIVSDNQSTTYIETDPEEARCELHGQDFKRVVNTPAGISLPSEAAPVTISCSAPGYIRTTEILDTSFDGWVLGNILFGGLIGVAVDAARGAGQKYPPQFMVILQPATFASKAEKEEWFDNRRTAINERFDKAESTIKSSCTGRNPSTNCTSNLEALEKKRAEELGKLDVGYARSKVRR